MKQNIRTEVAIGIDPGSNISGIGIIQAVGSKLKYIDHYPIRIPKQLGQAEELVYFADKFQDTLDKYSAETLVIESLFTSKNVRSILTLSHIRGVAMMLAAKKGLEVVEIAPATIKLNVAGYGRATKEQVQFMVQKLLKLDSIPKPNDCADALAMAISYLNQSRLMRKIRKSL